MKRCGICIIITFGTVLYIGKKENAMSYRYLDPERIMTEAAYWRFPGAAVAAFGEGIEDEYFCTGVRKLGGCAR